MEAHPNPDVHVSGFHDDVAKLAVVISVTLQRKAKIKNSNT